MAMPLPRLIVAGLSGDSGKTIVSLSLLAALRARGLSVATFKKGPDYIDASWLAALGAAPCHNLDTYIMGCDAVYRNFATHAANADVSIIEGNRGLFDGVDASGTHSTAALARLLRAPVVLVVSAAKATRTLAALIDGCIAFEPDIRIAGIVLNKVAGARHERVIREAIAGRSGLPILGAVPRLGADADLIPSRHLGLVTPAEIDSRAELVQRLADLADRYLDTDGFHEIAGSAPPLDFPMVRPPRSSARRVRIGFFKDSAFTFYYPDNLAALRDAGAELVPISSLAPVPLPAIDALYMGGGFPETHAEQLAANDVLKSSVRAAADDGMPIYAECGGLIFLARSLTSNGTRYPMAGVFACDLAMHARPCGHGYTRLQVDRPNPFYGAGQPIVGHEFHYSALTGPPRPDETCMQVLKGVGLGNGRDGLLYKNTLASYTHIHADGVTTWAAGMVRLADRYAQEHLLNDGEVRGYDAGRLPDATSLAAVPLGGPL